MKEKFLKLAYVAGIIVVFGIGCAVIGAVLTDSWILYGIWAIVMAKIFKKIFE